MDHLRGRSRLRRGCLGLGAYLDHPANRAARCAGRSRSANPRRATSAIRSWPRGALALGDLFLWGFGTALLTTLYGLVNTAVHPARGFSVGFCGILVATGCYLFTEFALRPVAAQALEAGQAAAAARARASWAGP